LTFQSFDIECTWGRPLFQKHVVRNKFDIYVFIKHNSETIFNFEPKSTCQYHLSLSVRRKCTKKNPRFRVIWNNVGIVWILISTFWKSREFQRFIEEFEDTKWIIIIRKSEKQWPKEKGQWTDNDLQNTTQKTKLSNTNPTKNLT
jgi:hypothetical protein